MHTSISYDSLLIISILAFITPLLSNLVKKITIPVVVIEIVLGIIIGKSGLNMIADDVWIHFLSYLGLAYLMFLSGLEIDFSTIKSKKNGNQNPLTISILMFILSMIITYSCSYYLYTRGYITNVYFVTLILAASAPGIVIPVLRQTKVLNSSYGQTLLIYSIIAEFVSLMSIALLVSFYTYGISYKNFLFLIVFVAFFLIYIIAKKVSTKINFLSPFLYTQHIRVRAAFALLLVLVTISEKVGSEIILGSFLAGVVFSLITDKTKEELRSKLDVIGYGFLIPIFFIMVGVNLDIKSVYGSYNVLITIPIILLIVLLSKLVPSLIMSFFYGVKKSISAGILLSSQLSLMIVGSQLAYEAGIIDQSFYSGFIIITIISAIMFPPLFVRLSTSNENEENYTPSVIEKLKMKDIVLLNPNCFNKKIKEISFPEGCRVFLVIRGNSEIVPHGNTIMRKDDHLVVVGFENDLDELQKMFSNYND